MEFLILPPCLFHNPENYDFFYNQHWIVWFSWLDRFSPWLGLTEICLTLEPVRAPISFPVYQIIFYVLYQPECIGHMSAFATPPLFTRRWIFLILLNLEESFFLLITYLKMLLSCPFLQQLEYLTLWYLLIPLKIAFPTLVLVLQSNVSTLIVCKIHSPMVCRCDQ